MPQYLRTSGHLLYLLESRASCPWVWDRNSSSMLSPPISKTSTLPSPALLLLIIIIEPVFNKQWVRCSFQTFFSSWSLPSFSSWIHFYLFPYYSKNDLLKVQTYSCLSPVDGGPLELLGIPGTLSLSCPAQQAADTAPPLSSLSWWLPLFSPRPPYSHIISSSVFVLITFLFTCGIVCALPSQADMFSLLTLDNFIYLSKFSKFLKKSSLISPDQVWTCKIHCHNCPNIYFIIIGNL